LSVISVNALMPGTTRATGSRAARFENRRLLGLHSAGTRLA